MLKHFIPLGKNDPFPTSDEYILLRSQYVEEDENEENSSVIMSSKNNSSAKSTSNYGDNSKAETPIIGSNTLHGNHASPISSNNRQEQWRYAVHFSLARQCKLIEPYIDDFVLRSGISSNSDENKPLEDENVLSIKENHHDNDSLHKSNFSPSVSYTTLKINDIENNLFKKTKKTDLLDINKSSLMINSGIMNNSSATINNNITLNQMTSANCTINSGKNINDITSESFTDNKIKDKERVSLNVNDCNLNKNPYIFISKILTAPLLPDHYYCKNNNNKRSYSSSSDSDRLFNEKKTPNYYDSTNFNRNNTISSINGRGSVEKYTTPRKNNSIKDKSRYRVKEVIVVFLPSECFCCTNCNNGINTMESVFAYLKMTCSCLSSIIPRPLPNSSTNYGSTSPSFASSSSFSTSFSHPMSPSLSTVEKSLASPLANFSTKLFNQIQQKTTAFLCDLVQRWELEFVYSHGFLHDVNTSNSVFSSISRDANNNNNSGVYISHELGDSNMEGNSPQQGGSFTTPCHHLLYTPLLGIMRVADFLSIDSLRDLCCAFIAALVLTCSKETELLSMLDMQKCASMEEMVPVYARFPFLKQ